MCLRDRGLGLAQRGKSLALRHRLDDLFAHRTRFAGDEMRTQCVRACVSRKLVERGLGRGRGGSPRPDARGHPGRGASRRPRLHGREEDVHRAQPARRGSRHVRGDDGRAARRAVRPPAPRAPGAAPPPRPRLPPPIAAPAPRRRARRRASELRPFRAGPRAPARRPHAASNVGDRGRRAWSSGRAASSALCSARNHVSRRLHLGGAPHRSRPRASGGLFDGCRRRAWPPPRADRELSDLVVDLEIEESRGQVASLRRLVVQEPGELVLGQHDAPGEVLERQAEQRLDGGVNSLLAAREHAAVAPAARAPRGSPRRCSPSLAMRTTGSRGTARSPIANVGDTWASSLPTLTIGAT